MGYIRELGQDREIRKQLRLAGCACAYTKPCLPTPTFNKLAHGRIYTPIPPFGKQESEDQKFKVIFCYTVNSRPA